MRFRVTESEPPRIDLASGKVMFTWLGGGHNGGNLRFGPDGMLYLASGDGGVAEPPDGLVSGQDLSTPLSGVLRIDVDRPDPGKTYGIPKDNPFVYDRTALPEIYASGLRNPAYASFDYYVSHRYLVACAGEYALERAGNDLFVVDDQHSHSAVSALRGRNIRNSVPLPTVLATSIRAFIF